MLNKINYVGFFPPNYNLGDEALYIIDREIFAKYNLKLDRIANLIRHKHSQTTLIGGGTSFPLITVYMRPTKYMYVFGVGVQDPLFHRFKPELIDRLGAMNFRLIGVRGNISKAFLKDWGLYSEVIGDPCLSIRTGSSFERCNNRLAINIGDAASKSCWQSRDRVLSELSAVCSSLKAGGYEIILIPFWKNNMRDVEDLSKRVGAKIFEKWQDIEATINLISTCKMLIGEKLHSLVFSAAANTPFIGLAYAPEHFDFADSIGFSKFTLSTAEITAEKILATFNEIVNNYEKIQSDLSHRVEEYREKQRKFAARISSDIESLPEDKWAVQNNYGNTLAMMADRVLYTKMSKIWSVWDKLIFSRLIRYLI